MGLVPRALMLGRGRRTLATGGRANGVAMRDTTDQTAPSAELEADVAALAAELAQAQPFRIVERALERFGERLLLSFSGAEDVLVLDLAHQIAGSAVRVFTLDTGRLHPETLEYLEQVRSHYGVALQVVAPEAAAVERLVNAKGLFSFRVDGHGECCGVRKVAPLRRVLAGQAAWMTGQRRDQSPGTRAAVPVVELDRTFGSPEQPLVKFNPLAGWTSDQVWRYLRGAGIPTNPLHGRGFVSIGCQPCTRPVWPGEHERAGRWWWEEATQKECGLHAGNLVPAGEG